MKLRNALVLTAITGALLAAHANAGECVGDLNGDWQIDGADLGLMLNAWGQPGGPADLNGSGTVDGADLGILLTGWGVCPAVVVIKAVHPQQGGPGTVVEIEGDFPTDDPFDACVVLVGKGKGDQAGIFAPVEIEKLAVGPNGQVLIGQIGPVPDWFEGEVQLMVVWGSGFPVPVPNPFEPLITLTDEGACWGDPQPGGANIVFNVGAALGGGACGPGFDASHVGTITGGDLCVTLPGGPGPNRTYPAGTKFEVWPRFHTCDGQYVKDCGTIRFTLNTPLTPLTVAGFIETLVQLEINACGPSNGLIPQISATPLGNNLFRICISLPGHPVCAGNLVICVDWP